MRWLGYFSHAAISSAIVPLLSLRGAVVVRFQGTTWLSSQRRVRIGLTAPPWVIDGAMNRELFELYVETQLAPTLRTGDVIILDNLSSHKSQKAAETMRALGA